MNERGINLDSTTILEMMIGNFQGCEQIVDLLLFALGTSFVLLASRQIISGVVCVRVAPADLKVEGRQPTFRDERKSSSQGT
jgi:hypothetical protein